MNDISGFSVLPDTDSALEAINCASSPTRRRVAAILSSYNETINRKIKRLNGMLNQNSTELFAMASNEAAFPFQTAGAEMRRMFEDSRHEVLANSSTPISSVLISEYNAALLEASKYDLLDQDIIGMLKHFADTECNAGVLLRERVAQSIEDFGNFCSCEHCTSFTTQKLDRLLAESLRKRNASLSKMFRSNMEPKPSYHNSFAGHLVPSRFCEEMNSALIQRLMLELEEIELNGVERSLEVNLQFQKMVGTKNNPHTTRRNLIFDVEYTNVADNVISYAGELARDISSQNAERIVGETSNRLENINSILTRLKMLSRILPV